MDWINQYCFAKYNGVVFVAIVYFIFMDEWNNICFALGEFQKLSHLKLAYCDKNLHLAGNNRSLAFFKYDLIWLI